MDKQMLVLGPDTKKILTKISESNGRLPLVYFSSNTFSTNYYFFAQLFYLSQVYKEREVNIAVILNDMSQRKILSSPVENSGKTVAKVSQILKIMEYFGVPSKNIRIHKLSEGWHNYLLTNEKAHFDFLHNLVFLDKQLIKIPDDAIKLDFLEKKAHYEIYYVVQKYIDLIISSNYKNIFPTDFGNEVDIHLATSFSYPLLEKIRNDLIKREQNYLDLPAIFSMPKTPFFGKSRHIYPEHIPPNIEMGLFEIARAINLYKLDKETINILYKNLLSFVLKKEPLDLGMSIQKQRVILAEDLFCFLKLIKQETNSNPKDLLVLSRNSVNSEDLLSLFRSPLTYEVLNLCNGENKVTDIAQKLNKHQPNISKLISKLKKFEVIQLNDEKKPVKIVNKLEFNL